VCYCLKLRRETPAGVALGVTDWKVVERGGGGILLPENAPTGFPGAWRASQGKAAVDGRLPRGIGVGRLFDAPVAWSRQQQMLGFAH
jgi:hypothetical protein